MADNTKMVEHMVEAGLTDTISWSDLTEAYCQVYGLEAMEDADQMEAVIASTVSTLHREYGTEYSIIDSDTL